MDIGVGSLVLGNSIVAVHTMHARLRKAALSSGAVYGLVYLCLVCANSTFG